MENEKGHEFREQKALKASVFTNSDVESIIVQVETIVINEFEQGDRQVI
jgi:hypothetical protein